MKIKVEYTAQMKVAAGVASEDLDVEASCSIKELLKIAADKHGEKLYELIFDSNSAVRPSILIALNDEQVYMDKPVTLKENDHVALLSPMAGG